MISLEVKVETSALQGYGGRLQAELDRRLPIAVRDAGNLFVGRLQQERLTGQGVAVRTGALRRSFQVIVAGTAATGVVGLVVTTSKYFAAHEYGVTIRPVSAKYLAIPLDAAKTPAGVPRYPSPLRSSLPEAFPDGVFVRNLVLFGKKGKKAIPLFVLRKQVVLQPRIGMAALWQSFSASTLPQMIGAAVTEAQVAAARGGQKGPSV